MDKDDLRQKVEDIRLKEQKVTYKEIGKVLGCDAAKVQSTYIGRINEQRYQKLLAAIEQVRSERLEKLRRQKERKILIGQVVRARKTYPEVMFREIAEQLEIEVERVIKMQYKEISEENCQVLLEAIEKVREARQDAETADDLRQMIKDARLKEPTVSFVEIGEVLGHTATFVHENYYNRINKEHCEALLAAIEQARQNKLCEIQQGKCTSDAAISNK